MNEAGRCSRSGFFKTAGLAAGAAVVAGGRVQAAETAAAGPARRRLGRSGLELPVVSLGTGSAQDVNVIKFAIAQGMDFIHTSTTYKEGRAIRNVAEAIKGQRDKVLLGLKITWRPDDDKSMEAALETLGVESVDIAFFHIHDEKEVSDPKYRAGAERWKKMGRFKAIGLTSHKETSQCIAAALDQGFYDALMPSYAMSMEEEFLPIFKRAEEQGVGVILMKTARGLGGAYADSVPHYLATPGITTITKGAASFQEVKQLVEASKAKADPQAGVLLRERAKLAMGGHCTMCGTCTRTCPKGFPVADVVRCSDYYLENAAYVDTAVETYRTLARAPSPAACGDCSLCEQACRNGVPVVHHIRRAEAALA